jgi:hypothetical protein
MRNLVVLFIQFHRHPDPVARTWRRLSPSYGVASSQAPTPDCESLPATISDSIREGPHPGRLDGALGASNSSAPFRSCTEVLDTARPSQVKPSINVSRNPRFFRCNIRASFIAARVNQVEREKAKMAATLETAKSLESKPPVNAASLAAEPTSSSSSCAPNSGVNFRFSA